jgi:hypothetical protein
MSVINPVKFSSPETPVSMDVQTVDERTVRTIQQQYQANHQEEFLRLRAQIEALLTELQALASNDSTHDSGLAL